MNVDRIVDQIGLQLAQEWGLSSDDQAVEKIGTRFYRALVAERILAVVMAQDLAKYAPAQELVTRIWDQFPEKVGSRVFETVYPAGR